ncbi:MAG: hypothetical protein ACREQW_10160 [Candidatus Binatia bacterium]
MSDLLKLGGFPEPFLQVSATGKKDYPTPEGIRVSPALAFLDKLI